MPLMEDAVPAVVGVQVAVFPSVAVELEWALAAGAREDWRAAHPTLAAGYGARPELVERVCAMWDPDAAMSCRGFMELLVLAHAGGMLHCAEPQELLGRLEELCTRKIDPDEHLMVSETPDDRRVILERLARLRRSAELRRRYSTLLRDVWAAVGDDWARYGRAAAEVACAGRRAALAKTGDWHEAARSECDFGELLHDAVAGLAPGGQVAVVPAFFTHRGLLLDLPGTVLVGVRTDTTGAEARARTDFLARRLKAMADPTRLAILDALCHGARTVTELATAFALAQPTVSNHVRVLRDAGLVADERRGNRRLLVVRSEAADELVAGLRDVLSGAAPAPGGGDGHHAGATH